MIDEVAGTKLCRGCSTALPFASFTPDKRCSAGVMGRCRSCQRKRRSERKAIEAMCLAFHRKMLSATGPS